MEGHTERTGNLSMAVKIKHNKGKWWVFIDYHGKEK
jgi:hypothetical protein